jgi:hypothetical protein
MEVEKQVFREGIWEDEAPAERHRQAPIENYKLIEFGSPRPNAGETSEVESQGGSAQGMGDLFTG